MKEFGLKLSQELNRSVSWRTGFCMPAQSWKRGRASQRKLGATSLGHSKRHQGLRREPLHEHLNGTLFDEKEMEQGEPPEETDLILHDDDDDAEDPESTGTAVAEAVVPIVFTPMRDRMCARIVPLLRTCQASGAQPRSWWQSEQSDMGCVILKDRVFRTHIALVFCCRDARCRVNRWD